MKITLNTEQWQTNESTLDNTEKLLNLLIIILISICAITIWIPKYTNMAVYIFTAVGLIIAFMIQLSINKYKQNKITEIELTDAIKTKEKQ